ncbi:hypothetical protein ACLI07_23260 (plasmid) [Providencia huaxiensis]|uniref:Nickase n=7 Tax=Enterobacterales TaxID=91347 RepID=A0A7L8KA69_ECOLX|nr:MULTISPECIES: hypothetical protein [Enterobacterales]ELB1214844.1 hypothetical protein [Proteus mirabilis]ELY4881486.1 hypothetical protein [Morganella morganii]SPY66598.1 Uncharacterised protein [Providencia stuartii]ELR5094285.1 hypothetical protein [Providencia rettgeri]ELR5243133.1 hypothetical protein [Providencia rettgeri]
MFTETMALISIAMFAMLLYRVEYIRFLAPLWIVLFVVLSGRAVTTYGFFTIVVFALLLIVFVLDAIRVSRKKAEKNRGKNEDDDSVSIFDEDEDENEDENLSSLPRLSASDDEETPKQKTKPKRTRITEYQGTLLSHGFAPYNNIIGNDKSYFVNCDGKTVWGIGLKDAIKNCGAENGDTIRFYKEGEVRTKKATIYDDKGNKTGTRNLSQDKRRGVWIMEVVSD